MDYEAQLRRRRFELLDPLENIPMSADDREFARSVIQRADWMADLIILAAGGALAVAAAVVRAVARIARRAGQIPSRPAPRAFARSPL